MYAHKLSKDDFKKKCIVRYNIRYFAGGIGHMELFCVFRNKLYMKQGQNSFPVSVFGQEGKILGL